jgi:endonuclease III related protein
MKTLASIPCDEATMDKGAVSSVKDRATQIREYYGTLYRAWGPQHWWPGRSRFEVIVGAILVQNTAWRNVELALQELRRAGALGLVGMRQTSLQNLETLIRPAGFFRQKARTLKGFLGFLDSNYQGSLTQMFSVGSDPLRTQLLAVRGIGPETADSILLYAGQHSVFVVDAYARRILARHEIIAADAGYDEIRRLVESSLTELANRHPEPGTEAYAGSHPPSAMSRARRTPLAQIYNEMHGLMVRVGKQYCLKSSLRCEQCPLQKFLHSHSPVRATASPRERQRSHRSAG